MLCARLKSLSQLKFPQFATPKLDGIRALNVNGSALTRRWKLVQNVHIRELLQQLPHGCDGELIAGPTFQSTQSAVMTREGKPEFVYALFDMAGPGEYWERVKAIQDIKWPSWVQVLPPVTVNSEQEFLLYEDQVVAQGFEGVVSRSPYSPYKCGRSTPTEGFMWKWKRTADSEAVVLSFDEQMENTNPIQLNAFGYVKRPGGKRGGEGRAAKGTLGSLGVQDLHTGVLFDVGTGFSDALRQEIWDNRELYLGAIIKYKYQDVGVKEKPRFPRFLSFRDPADIDEDCKL